MKKAFVAVAGSLLASSAFALPLNLLVNAWEFNEDGGLAAFDSVGTANGSLSGGATLGGGVVTFSGQNHPNSLVNFGTAVGQFGTTDFALEFRMSSTTGAQPASPVEILGNRNTIGHGNWVSVRGYLAGIVTAELDDNNGSGFNGVESPGGLFDGAWHVVRIERIGSSVSVSVDGGAFATATAAGVVNIANGADFLLGNAYASVIWPYSSVGQGGVIPFAGQVDYLRIYAPGEAAAVPLPGGVSLLGAGLLGMLGAGRLRKRAI